MFPNWPKAVDKSGRGPIHERPRARRNAQSEGHPYSQIAFVEGPVLGFLATQLRDFGGRSDGRSLEGSTFFKNRKKW
jgi:hypothetical protein